MSKHLRAAHIVFVLVSGICITTSTRIMAYGNKPLRREEVEIQSANQSAKEASIARERFQFIKRLKIEYGEFPLWRSTFSDCKVLFPARRSDRLYLLIRNGSWPPSEEGGNMVICYQRKDGKEKFVYRVNLEFVDTLETKDQSAKATAPVKSFLEHILSKTSVLENGVKHVESFAIKGVASNFALHDLAENRDYVEYSYIPYTDVLTIWLLSDLKDGAHTPNATTEGPNEGFYFLGEDPLTKAKLNEGTYNRNGVLTIINGEQEFYKKYGLPLAKGEFSKTTAKSVI